MKRVLLVNQNRVPHFRLPVYRYLGRYLANHGFELVVTAEGLPPRPEGVLGFCFEEMRLSTRKIAGLLRSGNFEALISWVDMKHFFLFPMYFVAKGLMRIPVVYWGQGRDLLDPKAPLKNLAYTAEQLVCDAIILYAEHLRKYVPRRFLHKVFIANNTLCIDYPGLPDGKRSEVLARHGIRTSRNIIFVGRIQRRKRLESLVAAHSRIGRPDVGLVLVGPDPDGILGDAVGPNVYRIGALYGQAKFDLLSSCEVYCLPGAVGLSIVDAFHCGLPLVTESGDESAEIGYLRDGENGFIVPRGDIDELAQKLVLLLDNDALRRRFSEEARREARENAHIDKLCAGFRDALLYVTKA